MQSRIHSWAEVMAQPGLREFLLVGGGLYCTGSLAGATRKYHGLVVERRETGPWIHVPYVLESMNNRDFELRGFDFSSSRARFEYDFPRGLRGTMAKEIRISDGCVSVCYSFSTSERVFRFQLDPLVTSRDAHSLNAQRLDAVSGTSWFRAGRLACVSNMNFERAPQWRELFYEREGERGYEASERVLSPGFFTSYGPHPVEIRFCLDLPAGLPAAIPVFTSSSLHVPTSSSSQIPAFSRSVTETPNTRPKTEDPKPVEHNSARAIAQQRDSKTQDPHISFYATLSSSLNSFIAPRGCGKVVVAGYPWFDEWGRDTLVFLRGYMRITRDYGTVSEILYGMRDASGDGLLRNATLGGEGIYNSADTQLLYVDLAHRYFQETRDMKFLKSTYPFLSAMLSGYFHGTELYAMDEDFLISCKKPQATWMDTRYTPRTGKCVEINALWHNALCVMHGFAKRLGLKSDYASYAEEVRESFSKFSAGDHLMDTLGDGSLRPNQLFASALPFPPVDAEWMEKILASTGESLLTPLGIRTLSQGHPDYVEYYLGSQAERDRAYHNGMAWPWLLGLYHDSAENLRKLTGRPCGLDAKALEDSFGSPENQLCLGYLPEFYDGFLKPGGSPAQAWSCSEVARILHESAEREKSEITGSAKSRNGRRK